MCQNISSFCYSDINLFLIDYACCELCHIWLLLFKKNSRPFSLYTMYLVLVSNYYGCKGEAIKLIPYYMIDIIYKTVKLSHLKKLKIIQNIKKPNVPSHLHIF